MCIFINSNYNCVNFTLFTLIMSIFKDFAKKGYKHYIETTVKQLDKMSLNDPDITTEFAHLIEWLRVNYNIHIVIMPKQLPDNSVVYYIWKGKKATFKETFYSSPQEAYSAAFDYILNNLI
jgi:hypothetical protein